jgi:hypothetical protein
VGEIAVIIGTAHEDVDDQTHGEISLVCGDVCRASLQMTSASIFGTIDINKEAMDCPRT